MRKRLDYWLDQVARDELAGGRQLVREARALNLLRDHDMMRINGWVDIESGERLAARLDPGPPVPDDTRTNAARRADLLLEMVESGAGGPGLTVHVSAQTLFEGKPGISETELGTFLTGDEISRISCDANLTRVVFDPTANLSTWDGRSGWSHPPPNRGRGPGSALCLPGMRPASDLV